MLGKERIRSKWPIPAEYKNRPFPRNEPPVSKVAPDVWNYIRFALMNLRINSSFQNKKVKKTKKRVKIS
jgi:hypothetical protein